MSETGIAQVWWSLSNQIEGSDKNDSCQNEETAANVADGNCIEIVRQLNASTEVL